MIPIDFPQGLRVTSHLYLFFGLHWHLNDSFNYSCTLLLPHQIVDLYHFNYT
jgi:hypothetical protein